MSGSSVYANTEQAAVLNLRVLGAEECVPALPPPSPEALALNPLGDTPSSPSPGSPPVFHFQPGVPSIWTLLSQFQVSGPAALSGQPW